MKKILATFIFLISSMSFAIDENPGTEIQDLSGNTINYANTVSTSPTSLPTTANKVISEVMFRCLQQTPATKLCYISLDGTTYFTVYQGEVVAWSLKGNKKQISIKGNTTGVLCETVINYENY